MQDCFISIANTLEILRPCTKPSIYETIPWNASCFEGKKYQIACQINTATVHFFPKWKLRPRYSIVSSLSPDDLAPYVPRASTYRVLTKSVDSIVIHTRKWPGSWILPLQQGNPPPGMGSDEGILQNVALLWLSNLHVLGGNHSNILTQRHCYIVLTFTRSILSILRVWPSLCRQHYYI